MTDRWWTRAACEGTPTSWFFPVGPEQADAALSLCGSCPVRDECLAEAMGEPRHQDFGIRGGLRREDRLRLRRGVAKQLIPDRVAELLVASGEWHTTGELARELGCALSSVQHAVRILVDDGVIEGSVDVLPVRYRTRAEEAA